MSITGIIMAAVIVGGTGLFIGIFLGLADKKLTVKVDEKEEAILGVLPGNNCGGCGYAGCSGLAQALVSGEIQTVSCRPCKPERRQEIADYLNSTPGPDGTCVHVKVL